MNRIAEFVLRSVLIGAGATLVMDGWALLLRQFGVPSLNFAFLGRWIGHLPRGTWAHENIAKAGPIRGELLLGCCAHYSIGITFAAVLLGTFGLTWSRSPSLLPALAIGIVTVVAPLFVLQPASISRRSQHRRSSLPATEFRGQGVQRPGRVSAGAPRALAAFCLRASSRPSLAS